MNLAKFAFVFLTVGTLVTAAPATTSTASVSRTGTGYAVDSLGIHIGPTFATGNLTPVQGVQLNPSSSRTRMTFGVNYEHKFLNYLSARAELNYVQRGFSSGGQTAQEAQTSYSIDYLELPLAVQGQIQAGAFTPYALTGPFVGMVIGKGGSTSAPGMQPQELSIDNQVNSLALGWNFGVGTKLDIARNMALDFGLRYSLGISNVIDRTQVANVDSIKLSAFQILAGVNFAL